MKTKRKPPVMTHEEMVSNWMKDPKFRAEYDKLEDEFSMLDVLLAARKEAGLTQAQVAERMGTKAPAVTRIESGLVSGTRFPSVPTLQKYAQAVGKKLQIRLV
jgi:DNA-binding XRE family transcriptional regulator